MALGAWVWLAIVARAHNDGMIFDTPFHEIKASSHTILAARVDFLIFPDLTAPIATSVQPRSIAGSFPRLG